MRNPNFIDLEEVAPGQYATAREKHKARAAMPAIGENKARPFTVDDIPDAGSPATFWVLVGLCFLALVFFRG